MLARVIADEMGARIGACIRPTVPALIRQRSRAFSAEKVCARIQPNNAMALSGKEWLWSAKRA
jgi:hypothetical protein